MNRRDFLKKIGLTPLAVPGLALVFDGQTKPDLTVPAPAVDDNLVMGFDIASDKPSFTGLTTIYWSGSAMFTNSVITSASGYFKDID